MANINNTLSNTVISGDTGANSIYNYGDNVTIYGGGYYDNYRDYIENHGSNAIISAGTGYDEIQNYGANSSIHGGAYSDIIYNYDVATYSTLLGGTANDDIRNYAAYAYINGGDGNDVIRNFGSNTLIDVDDDSVSGSNSVSAFASNVTVNVNGGNDTISAYAGDGTIILGGIRNDRITIVQEFSSNNGVVARVNAGQGNDTITASDGIDIFQYTNNDSGDDVIVNYDSNDIIELSNVTYRGSETLDNNDVVLHVGYGSITLKDAADKSVQISDTSNNDLPLGLSKSGTTINVNSYYEGGVWLTGFDILNWRSTYADEFAIEVNASGDTQADRVIVGNEQSNILRAGTNGAWLWGYLGNDTLVGGNGSDMFWFGNGEGADVIENCNDNDIVNLWSVNLSDLAYFDVDDDNNISVGLNDGSSLKINTIGSSTTFQLSNTKWRFDHNTRSFSFIPS